MHQLLSIFYRKATLDAIETLGSQATDKKDLCHAPQSSPSEVCKVRNLRMVWEQRIGGMIDTV